ncbi:hypothetical protein ACFLUV_02345 [Elusimicrobiota bacterium]
MIFNKIFNKNSVIIACTILFLLIPLFIPVNLVVEKKEFSCKNCDVLKSEMTYYYDFWKVIPPLNHTVNFVSNPCTNKKHIWEKTDEHNIKSFIVPAKQLRVIFFAISGFLLFLLFIESFGRKEDIVVEDDLSQPRIFLRLFKVFTILVLILIVFYIVMSFTVKFTKDIIPEDFDINQIKKSYIEKNQSYQSYQDALENRDKTIEKRVEEYFDRDIDK